jgi:two-component system sensor histidine kinase KdpD
MASRLKAELYVLTILPAAENQLNAKQKELLAMVRESGALFGAEVLIQIQGEHSIAQAITAAAKHHRITQIVLGRSSRTCWQEIRRGSIINEIMRHVREIDIQTVADDMER